MGGLGEEAGSTNPNARFNTIERWIEAKQPAKAAVKPAKKQESDEIPF